VVDTSILIVHPDRKTQRIVHRILGVTGYRIELADNLAQAVALVDQLAPRLVVTDAGIAVDPAAAAFFERARAHGAEACMTLLGATDFDRVPQILGLGAVTNLLVHAMPVLAEELTITAHKLMRGDLFGAEKYLLWGTQLHETTLERSQQRAEIVAELEAELRRRGQNARVAQMARLVADELISNAVHNAPVDAAGVHDRKDLPRDTALELDARHQVRVRWGCDARYVAVEVNDSFGSLDRDTVLAALARHEVREVGAGAGLGVALAYRSCDHLVFNLAPGQRTEVIALVDVRYPPSEQPPASSYNVFVEKTP
jgi:CheY-like chemotaxis protein